MVFSLKLRTFKYDYNAAEKKQTIKVSFTPIYLPFILFCNMRYKARAFRIDSNKLAKKEVNRSTVRRKELGDIWRRTVAQEGFASSGCGLKKSFLSPLLEYKTGDGIVSSKASVLRCSRHRGPGKHINFFSILVDILADPVFNRLPVICK